MGAKDLQQADPPRKAAGFLRQKNAPEEPGVLIVPRARFYDLVPVCELLYGPA